MNPIAPFNSLFLDSGAFTLRTMARRFTVETGRPESEFYNSADHWKYLDEYAEFVKKNLDVIDVYANVDVIPNPILTYRNQKYLEKQGIDPLPVIHLGSSMKWLQKYIAEGYNHIGLGGFIALSGFGQKSPEMITRWLDHCFSIICDTPDRTPRVKVHGFGVTNRYCLAYPWHSVDSTAWIKISQYGGCVVPHKRKGRWIFKQEGKRKPYYLAVSLLRPEMKVRRKHLLSSAGMEQRVIEEWFHDVCQCPIGKSAPDGSIIELGLVNDRYYRRWANLTYFQLMAESAPPYPWPWYKPVRKTLGFV